MKSASKGYTILEMAIAVMVFGILMAGCFSLYNLYRANKVAEGTAASTSSAVNAISNFLAQQGRYPCPARADATRDDPDYGMETQCDRAAADYQDIAAGACQNGLCVEGSARMVTIRIEGQPDETVAPKVRRGMVPFRSIGLKENFAYDPQGTRLAYAVTEILAATQTYSRDNGGISVTDADGNTAVQPEHSAHFVVVGAGQDRAGGFGRTGGAVIAPCNAATLDGENCNTEANRALYRAARYSTVLGAAHFDDTVRFYTSNETPLWRVSNEAATNIRDMAGGGAGDANVGVGESAPAQRLDVAGKMRASGQIQSAVIVDRNDDTISFQPQLIGGDVPDKMRCPKPGDSANDKYVIGVGDGEVKCGPLVELRCPAGQILVGIKEDRTLDCQPFGPPPMCPPLTVTECGNSFTWPPAIEGTHIETADTLDFSNNNGHRQFGYDCKKNATTGVLEWVQTYQAGVCNCVPTITDVNNPNIACGYPCQSQGTWNGTPYWQGSWAGDACFQWGNTCQPGGYVEWLPVSNTCVCAPQTNTSNGPCPNGMYDSTHYVTKQRQYTCDPANPTGLGTWSDWVEIASFCDGGCTPVTTTQQVPCPAGTGSPGETWTQSHTLQCPSQTWTDWSPTSPPAGACQGCNPVVQTQTVGCPNGFTGSYQQTKTWQCPGGGWGPATPASAPNGACTPANYTWKDISNHAGPFTGMPPNPKKGQPCNTLGDERTCYIPQGGQYFSATCSCSQ